jgi:hypothetical protein
MRKILILIPILILFLPFAYSSMDDTHAYFVDRLCKDNTAELSGEIQLMCKHLDAAILGAVAPDIAVFYYFDSWPNKYTATHTKSFCTALRLNAITEREIAFAEGACVGHLIPDSYSHNIYVPKTVHDTFFPNSVIHVFTEEKENDLSH